jgi:hypothetical protein
VRASWEEVAVEETEAWKYYVEVKGVLREEDVFEN